MKKTTRDRETIREELIKTYKQYKGLSRGSVAFRNVSRKLKCLDYELQEALK